MKIFYTWEPGIYGKFLDIQIVDSRQDASFSGWPHVYESKTSKDKKILIRRLFKSYKVKIIRRNI